MAICRGKKGKHRRGWWIFWPQTGSCCDGLHPNRVNENRGGESVVSYLLGLAQIRLLAQFVAETSDVGMTVGSAIPTLTELPQPRQLDTKHVLQ